MSTLSDIKKRLGLSTTLPLGSTAPANSPSLMTGAHLHSHSHGAGCGCHHGHEEDEDGEE